MEMKWIVFIGCMAFLVALAGWCHTRHLCADLDERYSGLKKKDDRKDEE